MLIGSNQSIQEQYNTVRKVFKDQDSYNFKYGLQNGFKNDGSGMDEDPIMYGFDIVIHAIGEDGSQFSSPLINGEIMNFFAFAEKNNIQEVIERKPIYLEFIEKFKLFFNDTTANFSSLKSHYLKSVSGLHNLVENASGISETNKQFTKYGSDKITLSMYEDLNLNSGYFVMLYKMLTYSKKNGKLLIPENLLRFDMSIIISEIRNFNLVLNVINSSNNGDSITEADLASVKNFGESVTKKFGSNLPIDKNIKPKKTVSTPNKDNPILTGLSVFNDNVSRYIYNLYDCQLSFPTYSHGDEVKNDDAKMSDDFSFDIFYKFSNLEVEKFNFKLNATAEMKRVSNIPSSANSDRDHIATPFDIKYRTLQENGGDVPYKVYINGGDEDETTRNLNGIQKIIVNTKNFALKRFREERDKLVNKTIENIRTTSGLRRISSPTNIYFADNKSIPDFFVGQLRNFANDGLTNLLRKANDKVSQISKNIDDKRAANGKPPINTGRYPDDIVGRDNVYKQS